MSSSQVVSTAPIYKLPIEAIHFIFEYMTEKDQLKFALTCSWIYRVFRVYHFGYASPKWIPINITQIHRSNDPSSCENIPNAPPAANYRDGVLLDGKFYLTIFEKESPICWILDFDEIPLSWKRANVTFVESESEEDNEGLETSDSADDKKSNIHARTSKLQVGQYQPLRSTAAAAISPIIYFFGGECLITGEPIDTLYKLDTRNMLLRQVKGQDGDLPSARKMHSLNTINNQFLALFGGRCLLMNADHPREFDSKDFYVYNISTKIWTIYRDSYEHVPYARSLHSTTVLECTLYVYGGQQITSSSTPDSQIHDDDDLWCFTFNSQDLPDEGQNTPESNTSNRTSNRSESPISVSFQNDRWQKLFSPRNFTSSVFSCGIGGEWHTTTGDDVGRRCGAGMFNVGKRVAVLGGYERDNWKWNEKEKMLPSEGEKSKDLSNNNDKDSENIVKEQKGKESDELKHTSMDKETTEQKRVEIEKPWELCKIYLPNRKRWDQVRILDFPEMECIAITRDQTNSNVFVMGRKKGDTEEQGITMGWIREEFGNN